MKKFVLIMLTVSLNLGLMSCTQESLDEIVTEESLTGGEEGQTPAGEDDEND